MLTSLQQFQIWLLYGWKFVAEVQSCPHQRCCGSATCNSGQSLFAPHSLVVERAVSHYNMFRNDKRMSMSLKSVNDRLLIAQNGIGTGQFDPRPAVASFLCAKRRRYREPKLETYSRRPFVKKFFRTEHDVLI